MLRFRTSARTLSTAFGLAWAATSPAQSLPSPAAPAAISQVAATPQNTSGGVISADHLFNSQAPQRVTPTGHRHGDPCRQQCQCPNCQAAACEDEGYQCCLFNSDAEALDLGNLLFGEDSGGWDIGGWTQFGYHNKSDGVFNTKPNDFQAQQIYMYAEKVADGSEGMDWGFRFDMLYGTDAPNTQSFGNHVGRWDFYGANPPTTNGWSNQGGQYGWAIPQLYGEVAYENLNVKIGHFYTLLGYQVVPATGNFFYSIPYTFNFSEAFTHTGVLGTYTVNDDVTVYGGWTLGWDTGFDQLYGGNSFLGGASVKLLENVTATYICTAGNLGWLGRGYTHSLVVDYVINEKWEYVFQSDLVAVDQPSQGGQISPITGAPNTHYDTIGVNQYLFYTITDQIKAGGRLEWWKADGTSYQEAALGVNIMPLPNVRIRPEVRHNWSQTASTPQPYRDTTIGAIDVIVTF